MPIKTRIDMLATGIKTPVGIKIAGPELSQIQAIGVQLETILNRVPGSASVYAERVAGGRYIDIDIDRQRAARFGMNIADIQQLIATAVGGANVSQSVEGLERYPINLRYPQQYRDSPEQLELLPIVSATGEQFVLGDVASISIEDGPAMIKSENARINGWVFVDIENIDVGTYVEQARILVDQQLQLPPGYSINWAGQYQYMQRAKAKLLYVVPLTLGIIVVLLLIHFRRISDVVLILGSLPFALVGSIWLMYWQEFNFSIAVAVGFIALAGVAAEIGVLMLVYLNQAWRDQQERALRDGRELVSEDMIAAVMQGAGLRVRPVVMTGAAIILGLLPILYGSGTGSEIMSRIAAPMVGGMISALGLTLLVLPVLFAQVNSPKPNKKP
jgi:Cu(I)/Ag(I) efflux system membrane protein CusA/SilA